MPSQYRKVKKFAGVYISESKVNLFRGKPDRTYWINFRDFRTKKLQWKRCGKASEGWTPEAAQKFRVEQLEKDRSGQYKSSTQNKADNLTLDEFFQAHYIPWISSHQKRPFDSTSRYLNWLKDPLGPLPLNVITAGHITQIINSMKAAGRAPATQQHVVKLIRHIYNRASEMNFFGGKDPCHDIKMPKVQNGRLRFLSTKEARNLLAEIEKSSVQTAQIATLSLYTGMRLGEIFALKWGDVDLERGIITILDSKNGESRPVFITSPIKQMLSALNQGAPCDYIFVTHNGNSVKFLSNSFQRAVDRLGLNKEISDRRQKTTFHTLRHTYASWAVMSGVPLFQVGKALGHKSNQMTERYSHLAPGGLRTTFEAVASFEDHDF